MFRLGLRTVAIFFGAVLCWCVDRVLCSSVLSLGIPSLHSIWHVGTAFTAYHAVVLFAYFSASAESPQTLPVLRRWPDESFGHFGVVYVSLKYAQQSSCKEV